MGGWGKRIDYIKWSLRKTFFISGNCFTPGFFADNICDPENNVPECGYDGGDCCAPGNAQVCVTAEECTCLDCNSPNFGQLVVNYS